MDKPLANPTDLKRFIWYPLTGERATGDAATGALLLESDAGAETDYILLESDAGAQTDYIELEAT